MAAGINLGALKFAGKMSSQVAKIRQEAEGMTGLELAPGCPRLDGPVCFAPELHEWIQEQLAKIFTADNLPKTTNLRELCDVVLRYHDKGRLWNFLTKLAKQSNVEHSRAADPDERKQITAFVEELFMKEGELKKKIAEDERQQSLQERISKTASAPKAGWHKGSPSSRSLDQVGLKRGLGEKDRDYQQGSTGPRRVHLTPLTNPPLASITPSQASNAIALPEDQEFEIPAAMQSLSLAKSTKNSLSSYSTELPPAALPWTAPVSRRNLQGFNMNLSSAQALRTDGVREDQIDADLRSARTSRPTTAATAATDRRPTTAATATTDQRSQSTVEQSDGILGSWGFSKKDTLPKANAETSAALKKVQRSSILGVEQQEPVTLPTTRARSSRIRDSAHNKNLFGAQGPSWWSLRLR